MDEMEFRSDDDRVRLRAFEILVESEERRLKAFYWALAAMAVGGALACALGTFAEHQAEPPPARSPQHPAPRLPRPLR